MGDTCGDIQISMGGRGVDILKMSSHTEFLQSFMRVDMGDDSGSEGGDAKKKQLKKKATEADMRRERGERGDRRRDRPRSPGTPPPAGPTSFQQIKREIIAKAKAERQKLMKMKRVKGVKRQEEIYTDKDRAAAVNMGSRDIKHSLKMKRRQDRSKALQIPEEAEPSTLLALGSHELRSGDVEIAINFVNKVRSPRHCVSSPACLWSVNTCRFGIGFIVFS